VASNRRLLNLTAAQAASDVRDQVGFDQVDPINVYAVADKIGVRVRFVDVNMEGLYQKSSQPIILISNKRPQPRRAFTCGHEIGHHHFGHGSTLDNLKADDQEDNKNPNEIMANAFASFLLLPTIGVRRAFNSRGLAVGEASPLNMLTVASEFGVGYSTLVNHLALMMHDISLKRRDELLSLKPKKIRKDFLGDNDLTALCILDEAQKANSVDLEIGHGIAVPKGTLLTGKSLELFKSLSSHDVYRAVMRGQTGIKCSSWCAELKISLAEPIGPAKYRYLEDPDE
jgi:Zn-dependent peptidase ImmA (M78 family)